MAHEGRRQRSGRQSRWGMAYTLPIIVLSWVLFRAESMSHAVVMYRAMLCPWDIQAAWNTLTVSWPQLLMLIISVAAAFRLEHWAYNDDEKLPQTKYVTVGVIVLIGIAVCWLAHLNAGMQNTFIYFQF